MSAGLAGAPQEPHKDYPKLVMLGVLHMGQYFPVTFAGVALPFLFRQQGLPLEMFWLLALPTIPRWMKWLIALAVDHYGSEAFGRRKSWIAPCTVLAALLYGLLAWIPPELDRVHGMVAILTLSAFVMAAQDVSVDAYAAEAMSDAERPVGTAIINLLAGVGGTLGAGAVALVETFGWSTTMVTASTLLLLAALPALVRPEPPPPEAARLRLAQGRAPDLFGALKRPDSRRILPFLFFFGFGQYFLLTMIGPFWADKGMTLTEFGVMAPVAAVTGGLLAAYATPKLIERTNMRVAACIGLLALPVEGALFFWFASIDDLPPLWTIIAAVSFLSFTIAVYTFTVSISRFRWVSKAQAGTDYSLQSSLWNLGVWVAGSTSGLAAAQLGYPVFFLLAAVLPLLGGVYYVLQWQYIEDMVVDRERLELQT